MIKQQAELYDSDKKEQEVEEPHRDAHVPPQVGLEVNPWETQLLKRHFPKNSTEDHREGPTKSSERSTEDSRGIQKEAGGTRSKDDLNCEVTDGLVFVCFYC